MDDVGIKQNKEWQAHKIGIEEGFALVSDNPSSESQNDIFCVHPIECRDGYEKGKKQSLDKERKQA